MTVSTARFVEGFTFEVSSASYTIREPCILVPVSAAEALSSQAIGDRVKLLIRDAWLAQALETADWVLIYCRDQSEKSILRTLGRMIEDYPAKIAQMRGFAGEDNSIDQAIGIVDFVLQKTEEDRIKKDVSRVRSRKIRSEMQADYSNTFVLVGRRDGFRCAICQSSDADLQIDHVIPVAKGGTNDPDNLQLLCANCNRQKSDRIEP